MPKSSWIALAVLAASSAASGQGVGKPVIDMHMHAWSLKEFGGQSVPGCLGAKGVDMHGVDPAKPFDFMAQATCSNPIASPSTDEEVLARTVAQMKRANIVAGVIAGDDDMVGRWMKAHPNRFIPAASFFAGEGSPSSERVTSLERAVRRRDVKVFAEITAQYRGLAPDDPALRPFYAMAERLDVPVGVHMGYGAPGGPYWAYPRYRAALGNPLLLEELLIRHPKMRVYVMHAGMPMTEEMIMVMNAHPQVFVDVSADNWGVPREEFDRNLKRLVDAGYGKRIMFGSDQMVWPDAIPVALEAITEAKYL